MSMKKVWNALKTGLIKISIELVVEKRLLIIELILIITRNQNKIILIITRNQNKILLIITRNQNKIVY